MLSYKHSAVRSHILTSKFLHSLRAFAFLIDLWCVCVCAGAAFFARPRKHSAVLKNDFLGIPHSFREENRAW